MHNRGGERRARHIYECKLIIYAQAVKVGCSGYYQDAQARDNDKDYRQTVRSV